MTTHDNLDDPQPNPTHPTSSTTTGGSSSDGSISDGGRPAAITWLAATGTALLFAAFAIFTITQWQTWNDLMKLAVLIAATGSAFFAGIRMQTRMPVTGSALAHLGALLVPIDATALAKSLHWNWPQLLVVQGVTGIVAIALLQRRASSIVLDYARPIAGLMAICGIAEMTHLSAPTLAAATAVALVAFSHERRGALTVAASAAFAPIAVVIIDAVMRQSEYRYGQGVARRLGIIDASPAWHLATAILAALTFALIARRSQRLSLAAIGAGAFTLNAGLAWSAIPHGSSLKSLAFPAVFVAIELLAFTMRRDSLFAKPTRLFARASEILVAVPTLLVASKALTEAHLDITNIAQLAVVLVTTGWLISLGRYETQTPGINGPSDQTFSRCMAIASGTATIAALAPTRLWAAGIVGFGATLALLVHPRTHTTDNAALTVVLWSVYAAHTTGWLTMFAIGAVAATAATAWRRKAPELLWFTYIAATALETVGLHDLGIHATPAALALCSTSAATLALASFMSREWRVPFFASAATSAFIGIAIASVSAPREIGNALFLVGIGLLAYGALQKHAFAANSGGALLVYGIWANLGLHSISQIEWYMLPLAVHLFVAGELYRRNASRADGSHSVSSWAAHGPALIALLLPSIVAGVRGDDHFHLLFAGAVAVLAVGIGGVQRLAAPLLLGTAALTVITFDMAVGPASHVESWVWLAVGGSALVATAIGMERTHTSPVAAGRRLIEVVNEQFV